MAIYTLDDLRAAVPQSMRSLSDEELVRDYSKRLGESYDVVATDLGLRPNSTVREMGKQLVGGAVVDLPKMVGQGLEYTGIAPEYGREMARAAESRAPGYEPDMRGRGLVGQALVSGSRGVAPMAAIAPLAFIPGVGEVAAGVGAATLFGTSSAQETYDKMRAQGISEEDSLAAARRVGMIQGPLEGIATVAGGRVLKGLAPTLGFGAKTTAGVAEKMTDTGVLKPLVKGVGVNAAVQTGTEVAQDLGTYGVEQAYGAQAENPYEIAKQSALGGFGLSLILGPLSIGGHVSRARKADVLQAALSEDAPPAIRSQAINMITTEARRQGVADEDIGSWYQTQMAVEKEFNDRVKQDALTRTIDLTGSQAKELPFMQEAQPFSSLAQQKQFEEGMQGLDIKTPFSSTEQQRGFEQDLMGIRDRKVAEVGQQYQDLVGKKASGLMAAQDAGQEFQQLQAKKEQGLAAATAVGNEYQEQRVERLKRQFGIEDLGQEWQKLAADIPKPVTTGLSAGQRTALLGPKGKRLKQTSSPFQVTEQQAPSTSLLPTAPVYSSSILPQQAAPVSQIADRPVTPPSGAESAVQPTTPVVVGASLKAPKRGPKTPQAKQAKAQGQKPAAAAESVDDELELSRLIQKANSSNTGGALQAGVEGRGVVKTPGKVSLSPKNLGEIRDALLSPEGKVTSGNKKLQGLSDAVRGFAKAYSDYEDAGGNAVRTPSAKKVETAVTGGKRRGEAVLSAAKGMADALTKVGEAAGGNAKDIEAIVAMVKTMTQRKLHTGKDEQFAKAFTTMDTMLSRGWNAAKNNVFRGGTDALYVRQSKTDISTEAKEAGGKETQLEQAAKGAAAFGKGDEYTGLSGILTKLRQSGTPMERIMAKAVRESLYGGTNEPNLVFTDNAKSYYDPKTHTVYLRRDASPAVVLHEALHAALQRYIYENKRSETVRAILRSLDKVVTYKGPLTGDAKKVQVLLQGLVAKGEKLDAALELISYGNTLNEFRTAMQGMEVKGTPKSFMESVSVLWNSLVNAMQRMLGTKRTVASDVIMDTLKLLREAEMTPAKGARTGNILEAAVESNKPLSNEKIAGALGVREADYTRWVEKNFVNVLSTQRLFEAIGWSKENAEQLSGKLAGWGRDTAKKYPRAEIIAGLLNSRYNVNSDVSNIQDDFKFDKNVGYQVAERIANYITSQPADKALAVFSYLDGDKKALDNVDDGGKLKGLADNMKSWFDLYVKELSPVEQRFFTTRKFSENLLFPSRTEEVARNQFGLGTINAILGKKSEFVNELDQDWLAKNADGDPTTTGDFYRVMQPNLATSKGGMIQAGFMSVARFEQLGRNNPIGYTVDTTRKWILESGEVDKGKFKFTTNTTAKEKIADQKADDLANALRNTMAALANNYASKNFINALANMGGEDSPHARVAFDSAEAINKEYGTNFQEGDDRILLVSEEMSRSEKTRELYRMSGTWVKLPKSDVFGALSDQYLPGPVWNSMIDMYSRQPVINSPTFNNVMRWFKMSKTTLNPGTHFTNAASNITMAMMHDISFKTMRDATKLLHKYEYAPKLLKAHEREMVEQFINSGAMLGDYSSAEVKEALYKAHENNLLDNGNDDNLLTRVAGWMGVEKSKAEFLQSKVGKAGDFTAQLYAFGDNAFRMAAFMKSVGQEQLKAGVKTPTEEMYRTAGKFALTAFGDYDIDSKAVKALRQTIMPFVSWGYAMGPMIGRMALTQPWKIANVLMAYYLLEAMMSGAAGGDDEELRKSGPDSIRERMFFGSVGPYMHVRIPFMGDDKNPVYYKLGDYFPAASLTKGLPNGFMGQSWIPSMVTPSGPFVSAVASLILGVDTYTGKSIHQPTDTEWQKLWNSTKAGYDIVSPPGISSKQIGRANDFFDGKTGITGVEPSPMVFARAFGLKLYDYNVAESEAIQDLAVKRIEKDFKSAMSKAKRDEYRKGYPDYEALDATLDDLRVRMDEEKAKKRGED